MSYASEHGFRPATRQEKITRGFRPGTRAYTNDQTGEVVSHRNIQSRGASDRYGAGSLEERARVRGELYKEPNPRRVFDNFVRHFAETPTKKGGLGAKFDKKTREYVTKSGERLTFQEVAASADFRDKERGAWAQWQRIRHSKGPRGERMRYNFLKRYSYMRFVNGKWKYFPQ